MDGQTALHVNLQPFYLSPVRGFVRHSQLEWKIHGAIKTRPCVLHQCSAKPGSAEADVHSEYEAGMDD
jgi:hypothetical protein